MKRKLFLTLLMFSSFSNAGYYQINSVGDNTEHYKMNEPIENSENTKMRNQNSSDRVFYIIDDNNVDTEKEGVNSENKK